MTGIIPGESISKLPLTISWEVFSALHPMDQLAALALEQVGKVQIIKDPSTGFGGNLR